jgi:hypothetical protein
MSFDEASNLDLRWRRSPLFAMELLMKSNEKSSSPASPAILLKLASESKGRTWSTWVCPAEMINNVRPCRFGGLAVLFHPDLDWLPAEQQQGSYIAGERLMQWDIVEMSEIEKRKVVLEKPTVFLFPLKSSHHV